MGAETSMVNRHMMPISRNSSFCWTKLSRCLQTLLPTDTSKLSYWRCFLFWRKYSDEIQKPSNINV